MRWVAYSFSVYHAAHEDLEPLCGAAEAKDVGGRFQDIDEERQYRMRRHHAYMCRRCQKLTDERPDWPWHREAPSNP